TQEKDVRPYIDDKSVEYFCPNLVGAKYTLATNAKGAELGIKDAVAVVAVISVQPTSAKRTVAQLSGSAAKAAVAERKSTR
ncbi:hypothetical protein AB9E03_33930, partial [Rhizobium leguminosarum]